MTPAELHEAHQAAHAALWGHEVAHGCMEKAATAAPWPVKGGDDWNPCETYRTLAAAERRAFRAWKATYETLGDDPQ